AGLRHVLATPSFVALEPRQAHGALLFAERREGKQKAGLAIAVDLSRRQRLHGGFLRKARFFCRRRKGGSRARVLPGGDFARRGVNRRAKVKRSIVGSSHVRRFLRAWEGGHEKGEAGGRADLSRLVPRHGRLQGFSRSRWPLCASRARRLGQFSG